MNHRTKIIFEAVPKSCAFSAQSISFGIGSFVTIYTVISGGIPALYIPPDTPALKGALES
jgi:hypothetical protein